MVTTGQLEPKTERTAGSPDEFDDDWRRVLAGSDERYLIYPSLATGRQADLFEWIKVQRIVELLQGAGIRQGRVLEYGCGAAGVSLYLGSIGYCVDVCDLSPYALKVAERNRTLHAPDGQINSAVVANVMSLPYRESSFDVVMSYGLLEHFDSQSLARLLDETIRVLKPGGLFVADIVPGPGRFSVRTLGMLVSYVGSVGSSVLFGRWRSISARYRQYFDYYYESTHDDRTWLTILRRHGLTDVRVDVCRPFPPLALAGRWEALYVSIIQRLLAFHHRFDGANNWLTRRWGWMYLASGRKR